ncbi:MAG: hypothetical protein ACKVOU_02770 [Cytophagales bacterium]
MEMQEDDLTFLPFLLDEDIYLIESSVSDSSDKSETIEISKIETKSPLIVNEPLPKVATQNSEIAKPALPKVEPLVIKPSPTFETPSNTLPNQLISKKVIIMVGYQSFLTVPPHVQEALEKIFEALKIEINELEIINVLATHPPKIEHYQFEYLILMGGNGKNLAFMQNYSGTRNRYDIAKHANKTIFFAESMDVYFKDIELKKKFWGKLKEVFGR